MRRRAGALGTARLDDDPASGSLIIALHETGTEAAALLHQMVTRRPRRYPGGDLYLNECGNCVVPEA